MVCPSPQAQAGDLSIAYASDSGAGVGTDIFVSFASAEGRLAEEIVAALERAGHSCWYAPREVGGGADYATEIVSAVSRARRFLLLYSQAAEQSPHVGREIHLAAEHRVPIVPVRTVAIKPSGRYAYFLAGLQWIDLFDGERSAAVGRVVEAVGRDGQQQLPKVVHSAARLAIECGLVFVLLLAASWTLSGATDGPLFLRSGAGATAVLVMVSLVGVAVHVSQRLRPARAAKASMWGSVVCLCTAGVSLGGLVWLHGQWTLPVTISRKNFEYIGGTAEWPIVGQDTKDGFVGRILIPPQDWRTDDTNTEISSNSGEHERSPLRALLNSDNLSEFLDRLREHESAGYARMAAVYLALYVAGMLLFATALARLVALTGRFVLRRPDHASGAFS